MAGPSWVAGLFAAVMILTAGYSASRLAVSRLRGLVTEADGDGLHAVMGTAMAGMLVPQLTLLPRSAWAVVFGVAAVWFGACAIGTRSLNRFSWQCRYPVPHLIECIAMLYMLLLVPGARAMPGMAMPGMGTSPGAAASFLPLAVILALFMIGYLMWNTDQLASLARAQATPAIPARAPEHRALVTVSAAGAPASLADAPNPSRVPAQEAVGGQVQLAPRLAALGKIAMSITMGYMLLLML